MSRRIFLVGQKFGKLLVVKETNIRKNRSVCYLCKCDCGNYKIVNSSNLKRGSTKSCGCLYFKNTNGNKHGLSHTKFYNVYKAMLHRCYNKNNKF